MGVGVCSKLEFGTPGESNRPSAEPSRTSSFQDEEEDDYDFFMEDSSSATGASIVGDAIMAFDDMQPLESGLVRMKGTHSLRNLDGAAMEEAVAAIADIPRYPEGVFDYNDLFRPYAVFKEGLYPSPQDNVKVRVGPVVGKVTDTSAIILLEVDTHAEVSLNFARIYENSELITLPEKRSSDNWQAFTPLVAQPIEGMLFAAEGSCTLCHIMEPGTPTSFEIWGLAPATSYLAVVSNVCEADMRTRVARFRTFPRSLSKLRLVTVSGNRAAEQNMGKNSPWCSLHKAAKDGPDVQVVLHAGPTVDIDVATDKVSEILHDFAFYKEGFRKDLERQARDALRAAFCAGWGEEEGLRCCLADVGSHLPIFAPLPASHMGRLFGELYYQGDSWKAHELRALLRVSMDVYYEYQRALWHESASMSQSKARLQAVEEQEIDYEDAKLPDEYIHKYQPPGTGLLDEWHFHKYGRIGIFMLDTKGGRFQADGEVQLAPGSSHSTCPLISEQQWAALKEIMLDESMRMLILVSDAPFFVEDAQWADRTVDGTRDPPVKDAKQPRTEKQKKTMAPGDFAGRPSKESASKAYQPVAEPDRPQQYPLGRYFDWCSRPDEIKRLLMHIFQWKLEQYPKREVVLVSGGPSCGTVGNVIDHELGLSIPLVVTGPACGSVSPPRDWALCGSLAKGRFSYVYRPPMQHCNFCTIDIELDTVAGRPSVDIQSVHVPLADNITFPERRLASPILSPKLDI
jgi:hypothetical protein